MIVVQQTNQSFSNVYIFTWISNKMPYLHIFAPLKMKSRESFVSVNRLPETSRTCWTYFPQRLLNIPQILNCVHDRRSHITTITHLEKIHRFYQYHQHSLIYLRRWPPVWNMQSAPGMLSASCDITAFRSQRPPLFRKKTYSRVNWSRNIPVTGSKRGPLDQFVCNK